MMSKALIWLAAVLGLVPAILAAVLTLFVHRMRQENTDMGDASMQIGPFATKLNVSSHPWAAVMLLTGAALVFVGLLFLFPGHTSFVRNKGFSRIEYHIKRLLRSPSKVASLIIATPDEHSSVLLIKESARTTTHVSIQRGLHPGQETKLRTLCKELGIAPAKEILSSNGGIDGATITFEFVMSENSESIANFCTRLLTDVFGATDRRGLQFIARSSKEKRVRISTSNK